MRSAGMMQVHRWIDVSISIIDDSLTPPGGRMQHCRKTHPHAHQQPCIPPPPPPKTCSVFSTCPLSAGPIFSPIKSLIALGNKESINPVSANKAPAVWRNAAKNAAVISSTCGWQHACVYVCVIFIKRAAANPDSCGCASFIFLLISLFCVCVSLCSYGLFVSQESDTNLFCWHQKSVYPSIFMGTKCIFNPSLSWLIQFFLVFQFPFFSVPSWGWQRISGCAFCFRCLPAVDHKHRLYVVWNPRRWHCLAALKLHCVCVAGRKKKKTSGIKCESVV